MEPIILNENLDKQDYEIKNIHRFCSKLNEILPEFEKETGYKLNVNEVIMLLERTDLDELIAKVNQAIEAGLGGINITGIIRKTFTSNTAEFVYSFADKLKRNYNNVSFPYLQQLSLENGLLTLSKENEKAVREKHINYIKTDEGKRFYDLHQAAAKSLNELSKFIKQSTRINHVMTREMTELFLLDNTTGEVEINPHIGYDSCISMKQ